MTTFLLILAAIGCALAVLPATLFFRNLSLYAEPPATSAGGAATAGGERVSVLIPARNEARGIADCVTAALGSRRTALEVIVLDDHSDDGTANLVEAIARTDARVRVETAPPLPPGWCGKQHACHVLAGLASHPLLVFIDADVRLTPDGLARAAEFKHLSGAALVSGVPRQETGTLPEKLLIPMIHFLLLSYLPVSRMRRSTLPAYGAGCGQFFMTDRAAYETAGGHKAIWASWHDGISLPRAYRRAGLATDLFDATPVAVCRMYRSGSEVWPGLAKNATQGMATPAGIVPWSLLLLLGQVLPAILLVALVARGDWHAKEFIAAMSCGAAVCASLAVRLAAVVRFRQSLLGAVLHPFGVMALVAIQWVAFLRSLAGAPASWKGRTYGKSDAGAPADRPA